MMFLRTGQVFPENENIEQWQQPEKNCQQNRAMRLRTVFYAIHFMRIFEIQA